MGNKSKLRMTGRTEQERIDKPMKLNNREDILKTQKQVNKSIKIWKHVEKHFKGRGRVGV